MGISKCVKRLVFFNNNSQVFLAGMVPWDYPVFRAKKVSQAIEADQDAKVIAVTRRTKGNSDQYQPSRTYRQIGKHDLQNTVFTDWTHSLFSWLWHSKPCIANPH